MWEVDVDATGIAHPDADRDAPHPAPGTDGVGAAMTGPGGNAGPGAWIDRFAGLARLPADLRDALVQGSSTVAVPAGTQVFAAGQSADNLLLLLSGTVRVQQRSDTGREVFLYRVNAGESCVLTTACMIADEDYAAEGVAETDVTAVAIPRATFDDLAGRSPVFRSFVFRAYSRRIADLFALIDDIVFRRMDVRLAERLLDLARDGSVHATHQVLAAELGTAREVISRTLAEFQRRGWVEQARGEIRIPAPEPLERMVRAAGGL
jgi:CRP/FNR family transcriptional regulator, anaerobic regulatory protein